MRKRFIHCCVRTRLLLLSGTLDHWNEEDGTSGTKWTRLWKKGTRIACMVCVFGGKERKTTHRQCYIYIKAARRGPFVRKLINFSWMSRSPRWCFLSKSWYNNGISGYLFQKSDWMLGREKDGMQMHVYFMIYKRVGLVRNFDSPFRSFCSNDSLNNESDKSMYENVWQVEAPWKWGNPCSLDTV